MATTHTLPVRSIAASFFATRFARVLSLLWFVGGIPVLTFASQAAQPNIVFILSDDMGYGDLSCYGRKDLNTPHLDQLAREGVRFTQFYANGPECTPTRAAFLTGRYQQRLGGLECAIGTGNVGRYDDAIRLRETNELGLPSSATTIGKLLQNQGYTTILSGKWHLGYEPQFAPHHHGFDHTFYCIGGGMDYFHYLDTVAGYNLFQDGNPIRGDGYFTDLMTDNAIRFIKSQSDKKPFFLYLPYTCPHAPFQGPEEEFPQPIPLNSPRWKQGAAPPDVYIDMIEHMDKRIGDLLKTLDQQRLRENTVVIFNNDNGGTASARNEPLSGYKGGTYEGGIRVPTIIRWPGMIRPGTTSDQVAITFDLSRSIARIAGVPTESITDFEGMDIIDHIVENRPNQKRTLFWRKPRGQTTWHAVRDGNLKYVAKQSGLELEEHLYDIANDIGEKQDLKTAQAQEFKRLQTLYRKWEIEVRKNRRGQ